MARSRLQRPCLVLSLALCLVLCGCLEVELRLQMKRDGSGVARWRVEILPQAAVLGLTAAQLKEQLRSHKNFSLPGVRFVEGRAGNGNEVLTVIVPFRDVKLISGRDFVVNYSESSDRKRWVLSVKVKEDSSAAGILRVRMVVEMPGKIVRSNADQVSGTVAHFSNLFRGELLYVESTKSSWVFERFSVAVGVLGILVLLGMGIWAWRRRLASQTAVFGELLGGPGRRGDAELVPRTRRGIYGIYCAGCGAHNRPDAKFCRRCGMQL